MCTLEWVRLSLEEPLGVWVSDTAFPKEPKLGSFLPTIGVSLVRVGCDFNAGFKIGVVFFIIILGAASVVETSSSTVSSVKLTSSLSLWGVIMTSFEDGTILLNFADGCSAAEIRVCRFIYMLYL